MWGGGNENVAIPGSDEGLFLVGRRCRSTIRAGRFTVPARGAVGA